MPRRSSFWWVLFGSAVAVMVAVTVAGAVARAGRRRDAASGGGVVREGVSFLCVSWRRRDEQAFRRAICALVGSIQRLPTARSAAAGAVGGGGALHGAAAAQHAALAAPLLCRDQGRRHGGGVSRIVV